MKIAVVNLPSVDGGGLTVLKDLNAYALANREHRWEFIIGPQDLQEGAEVRVSRIPSANKSRISRLRAENRDLPRAMRSIRPDVVLSLQNLPIRGFTGRQWVYLHQPLPFQTHYSFSFFRRGEFDSAFRQKILGAYMKTALRRVDGVLVQTAWMRDTVELALGGAVPVVRVGIPGVLAPEAAHGEFLAEDDGAVKADEDRAHLFFPAGPSGYKNFVRLRRAVLKVADVHPEVRCTLTLTEDEFRSLAKADSNEELGNFEFLGRIPHEEVLDLLSRTTLVFPSFIETLGLPLVEARIKAAWILACDLPFAREVLQGYPNARYFDAFDVGEMARTIQEHITDGSEKAGDTKGETLEYLGSSWDRVVEAMKSDFEAPTG